jgi:hypothetical protein
MNEANATQLKEYLQNVTDLFANIEIWSVKRGLKVNRSILEISEEEYGAYTIKKLILTNAASNVADIIPIGCSIVGSYGRVDLVGQRSREVISYLRKGGPCITQSELIDGVMQEVRKKYFYKDINESGWYWIESTRLGRAKKINEVLFFDLLASVSDYEHA